MQGITALLDVFQQVPAQIYNCQDVVDSWNEVSLILTQYLIIDNWVQIV